MRARLEERERDRRKGMEKRRKQQARKRYGLLNCSVHVLCRESSTCTVHTLTYNDDFILLCRATQELTKATEKSSASTAVSVAPGATALTAVPADGDTLHFKLSSHDLHQLGENPQQLLSRPSSSSTTSHQHIPGSLTPTPTPSHTRLSEYLNHNGPECYVKPQSKSNKKIIKNALCHVCLAGEVNVSLKQRALAVSVMYLINTYSSGIPPSWSLFMTSIFKVNAQSPILLGVNN